MESQHQYFSLIVNIGQLFDIYDRTSLYHMQYIGS